MLSFGPKVLPEIDTHWCGVFDGTIMIPPLRMECSFVAPTALPPTMGAPCSPVRNVASQSASKKMWL
jgi:hypothetical protein